MACHIPTALRAEHVILNFMLQPSLTSGLRALGSITQPPRATVANYDTVFINSSGPRLVQYLFPVQKFSYCIVCLGFDGFHQLEMLILIVSKRIHGEKSRETCANGVLQIYIQIYRYIIAWFVINNVLDKERTYIFIYIVMFFLYLRQCLF